jgi:glycolate oxidase FAD binding subunit
VSVGSAMSLADVVSPEALVEPGGKGSFGLALGREPDAVVAPGSVEEVVALLAWAESNSVGVIPVGTGAHLGDRRPAGPFVALSTERLTGVEIYEPADLTLTARSGTRMGDLARVAEEHRQWLPFDPMDVPNRTLGGLASAGVTGPLASGYGHLRNHVLGMTVVCGDGRVLRLGGRVVKNVAGFDLIKPMVGSRGRLAVITSLTVRLFPLPALDRVLMLESAKASSLLPAARAVATAPILPASLVLSASGDAGSRLLVRLHGARETVDADQRTLESHAGVVFAVAEGSQATELLTATRNAGAGADIQLCMRALPAQLGALLHEARGPMAGMNDVSMVDVMADVIEGSVRLSWSGATTDAALVIEELRSGAESLGGTVTVDCCPVGMDPAALSSRLSADAREIGEGVKRIFDPGGVLL